jgi:CheY-like chemotaxis protein
MHMPGMDGLDLSHVMRQFEQARKLPVVMLSSLSLSEIDPARRPVGFFNVIPKPWKPSVLKRELLRILSPDPAASAVVAPKGLLERETGRESPVRILVVEDNPTNRKVIITVLKALGYEPDVAENGTQGIERVNAVNYDLILLDVQMPDVNGLAVSRHVRALNRSPRTAIVAVTAGVTPEDRQACFDAGMDDFVMKPFKVGTLKDTVLKYARQPKSAA